VVERDFEFQESFVDADGFRIRYLEAGDGPPLVHLHGAGGLRLTPAHDLLCRHFRVIAFEMPGFGASAENLRTRTMREMAATMAVAVTRLGVDRFNLMGTSFGGKVALWLAVQSPERVVSLVLEAPAAIRPEGTVPPSGSPEDIARRLYAHPERIAPAAAVGAAEASQTAALTRRLRGPDRDAELEADLRGLMTPALVMFGTRDSVIPPEMGRVYKELMANVHLIFVYDAGHGIAMERPEAFAEAVVDFLERNDAFVISRARTVILP
jgi:pimeloyl-ACP methyl ester carboxylesterase